MINVCHVTTVHSRYDVRIFEKECTSLAELGYNTTLIVNDQGEDEVKNGVNIVSLHQPPRNRIDRATRIVRIALQKALEVDADIYHLHDPELLRIAKKLCSIGKKVVFDSHEFTAMQIMTKPYLPAGVRGLLSKVYLSYENRILNTISGLVVPCSYNGRDYFDKVHKPKAVIGNYPKLAILEQYADRSKDAADGKVCYVGGISASRGLFHMVRGAYIAGRKLVLIGNISDELRTELEQMPEFSCVELLGRLPHDIALREMAKCSAGLSLLQDEGQYAKLDNLPTKLYEYMSMGIPAVVSNFSYYCETLKCYKYGIAVDPSDDNAIAEAINKVIDDEKLRTEMMSEGRRAIRETMNWEADAEKLDGFYKNLCHVDQY